MNIVIKIAVIDVLAKLYKGKLLDKKTNVLQEANDIVWYYSTFFSYTKNRIGFFIDFDVDTYHNKIIDFQVHTMTAETHRFLLENIYPKTLVG